MRQGGSAVQPLMGKTAETPAMAGSRPAQALGWPRIGDRLFVACAVIVTLALFSMGAAFAQTQLAAVSTVNGDSSELTLRADGPVQADLTLVNNVAVISFDQPVMVDAAAAARALRNYMTLARLDDDGRALRIALRRGVHVEPRIIEQGIVLSFSNGTPVPALPTVAQAEAPVTEPPPAPPVNIITVTLSPEVRPEYIPPFRWAVDVSDEPGVLTFRFSGGEMDIDASLSTRIAVLTFPGRQRPDMTEIVPDNLDLLQDAEPGESEDGHIRLTLAGMPGTIASHRRDEHDLFVAFRVDMPEEAAADSIEEERVAAESPRFQVGLPAVLAEPGPAAIEYTGELTEELVAELAAPIMPEERLVLTVEVLETSDGIRLHFPWTEETPAAIFRRGTNLWIAFEADADLNIDGLQRRFRGLFRDPQTFPNESLAVMRLEVPNYVLTTTSTDGFAWLVTLGEAVVQPTVPLEVIREPNHEHSARVQVEFPGASGVHHLRDPDIGDDLILVTGVPPVRGMVTPRMNVDFALLETAQGLAIEEYSDNLLVSIAEDTVVITAEDGLALSEQIEQELELEVAEVSREMPGYMDFDAWSGGDDTSFLDARLPLFTEVAIANGPARDLARMNLVRFYLARGYNAEALGVLRLMANEDQSILENTTFRSLRGVSLIRMRRFREGIEDLSVDQLQIDENAALWRGFARFELGDIPGARREFSDGARMLSVYGSEEQVRFRLTMARTAWQSGDYVAGQDELANIPDEGLPWGLAVEVELVRGMMAEGLGNNEAAFEHYNRVIRSQYEPMVVRGLFRKTRLLSELGEISTAETIQRLEAQRFRWRGDDLELDVLTELGRQYIADQQYREGLDMWRLAVAAFPDHPRARDVGTEMQEVFVSLFLEGEADEMPPIRALGLFYAFTDLIPIGRQGDDMIRHLADRLVSVDLLSQAAELLAHQVDNRLRGVGRAQVATRLAIVYLLDRRPAEALQAIRSTRQTLLPEELNRQRRMIEARALAAMERYDQALDIISNERREEINRLRAEIQWEAEYWTDAAEGFEELLGAAWRSERPLEDEQRTDVMRAAIAYVFADDDLGLTRLRTKYARLMNDSPDAEAFEIVTGRPEVQGVAFREMARRIAAVDTFDSFMARMREEFVRDEIAALN